MVDSAGGSGHVHDDEDGLDGCTCGLEFEAIDIVADEDLPAAGGGVQAAPPPNSDEADVDGCLIGFGVAVTADHELPPATGGVRETR